MCRRLVAWALVLGAALLPGGASAQSGDGDGDLRARELYENGRILFDEGLYEDAISAWEAAWELSARPLLLYNIASAQERLGQWVEAMDTLNRYRAYAPAEERPTLERRIRNLEVRIAEQQRQAGAGAGAVSEPPADRGGDAEPPDAEVEEAAGRGWSLALAGTGAAGLGAGTWLAARALAARDEALLACVGGPPYTCSADAADALRRDRLSSALADGAFVIGVAGVVGGLVTWGGARAQVGLAPGGLTLSGSF